MWRPPPAQLLHTRAVIDTLVALHQRPLLGVEVEHWEGEGGLRAMAHGDEPIPDATLDFRTPADTYGRLALEVDRGTEGRSVWQAKLRRYVRHPGCAVLTVTTTNSRALQLARLAADAGVPMAACTFHAVFTGTGELDVLDARHRRRGPIRDVLNPTAKEL